MHDSFDVWRLQLRSALGVRGPTIEGSSNVAAGLSIPAFGIALTALASSGDVNVLSTPHIIAMDNVQAELSVGENVPLQTSGIAGGIGNLGGAMLGGVVLGLVESLGAGYIEQMTFGFLNSSYQDIFAFIILGLVLIFKPTGLLGERVSDRA